MNFKGRSDQELLDKWAKGWMTHPNPVTRSTYRMMYLRLYFQLYLAR